MDQIGKNCLSKPTFLCGNTSSSAGVSVEYYLAAVRSIVNEGWPSLYSSRVMMMVVSFVYFFFVKTALLVVAVGFPNQCCT